jgi:uroporphyrinogen-III synthase
LLARAAVARDLIPRELAKRGATVDVVEAYRTVTPANLQERAAEIFARHPDWVTFTSSSTAHNLMEAVGAGALAGSKAVSIGPITSGTLRSHGIDVAAEAKNFTIPGLVEAILAAGIIGA